MNTAKQVFSEVLAERVKEAAADLRRSADELASIVDNIDNIGMTLGITARSLSASDLAANAVRAVHRNTPNLSGVVMAAADYDRNVQHEDGAQ